MFLVSVLKAVPVAAVVVADLAGEEAEAIGGQHPDWYKVCGV